MHSIDSHFDLVNLFSQETDPQVLYNIFVYLEGSIAFIIYTYIYVNFLVLSETRTNDEN